MLYVDDEADVREVFAAVLGDEFDIVCALGGQDALAILAERNIDVLVSDLRLRSMRGYDLLAAAFDAHPHTARIAVGSPTEHDELPEFVRGRVFAFLPKPWASHQLRLAIRQAATLRRLERENRRRTGLLPPIEAQENVPTQPEPVSPVRPRLVVMSVAMKNVLRQVDAVATTDASVLLHGETGTGKELVAAEIHERSAQRRSRFVAQNLAALPPELLTSELFGHVKGAFTGAQQARRGLFETADGGTLFLAEIGEAPPSLQALLLRALETRELWPVGAGEPRTVDVRIVAATNRDLLAEAHRGLFRLDLYYRLAVCPIMVPPLRARPEDVRAIGHPMLQAAARRMKRALPRVSEAAWRTLEEHPWPGNVRELANVLERLVIYQPGQDVEPGDLELGELPAREPARVASDSPAVTSVSAGVISLDIPEGGTTFDDLEREILVHVLERKGHNQSRAARLLGMSESTFRSRMKRLGLKS